MTGAHQGGRYVGEMTEQERITEKLAQQQEIMSYNMRQKWEEKETN